MNNKKTKYIVLDTETRGGFDSPVPFDISFAVVDNSGKVYAEYAFIVYETYCMEKELMLTDDFSKNKIPLYEQEIKNGNRIIKRAKTIRKIFSEVLQEYNIDTIMAHNARFDINALNNLTNIYICKNQKFLPDYVTVWCTLKMARQIFKNKPTYRKFCENNGFMTKNNQLRYTAEILYRYIISDTEFVEQHMGIEDVRIEKEIFVYMIRQHKKMDRVLYAPLSA